MGGRGEGRRGGRGRGREGWGGRGDWAPRIFDKFTPMPALGPSGFELRPFGPHPCETPESGSHPWRKFLDKSLTAAADTIQIAKILLITATTVNLHIDFFLAVLTDDITFQIYDTKNLKVRSKN